MLFHRRIRPKHLADFLRRLGMSLEAGIDIRRAMKSEVERSPDAARAEIAAIEQDIAAGRPLAQAITRRGDYFPPLVRELVDVGEQTGHLPEVLRQLSEHYELRIAMRREFLRGITWPMVQFGIALSVVGFLIWISGVIPSGSGKPTDLLDVGLTGTPGLIVYLLFLGSIAGGVWYCYMAAVRGKLWIAPVQRALFKVPMLGGALRTLAIARFAWTLYLTTSTALDVKKSLRLALRSTHHVDFTEQIPSVEDAIQDGQEIHEALAATGQFPPQFIHAVQVGEESGRLTHSLELAAKQYQDEAQRALAILTQFAGFGVWGMVAAMIIVLIFKLFTGYVSTIYQLSAP